MSDEKKVKFDINIDTQGDESKNADTPDQNKSGSANQQPKRRPWGEKKKEKDSGKTKDEKKNTRQRFVGAETKLEGHIFYYGKEMAGKCLTSREAFLLYAGSTYSASEKMSLINGTITLIGVKAPKQDYTNEEFQALLPFDRED